MYDIQDSDVIHALRCSSSEKAVCLGDSCPYFYKAADVDVAAFLEKHGYTRDQFPVDFFDGCDVDLEVSLVLHPGEQRGAEQGACGTADEIDAGGEPGCLDRPSEALDEEFGGHGVDADVDAYDAEDAHEEHEYLPVAEQGGHRSEG